MCGRTSKCVSLSPSLEMLLINGGPNLMFSQIFYHFLGSSLDNIQEEPFRGVSDALHVILVKL